MAPLRQILRPEGDTPAQSARADADEPERLLPAQTDLRTGAEDEGGSEGKGGRAESKPEARGEADESEGVGRVPPDLRTEGAAQQAVEDAQKEKDEGAEQVEAAEGVRHGAAPGRRWDDGGLRGEREAETGRRDPRGGRDLLAVSAGGLQPPLPPARHHVREECEPEQAEVRAQQVVLCEDQERGGVREGYLPEGEGGLGAEADRGRHGGSAEETRVEGVVGLPGDPGGHRGGGRDRLGVPHEHGVQEDRPEGLADLQEGQIPVNGAWD